jgi:APA family basic amino acid/polyamine antiporter
VANAAAFTLPGWPWHAPRWLNVLGFLGCLVLAGTLPPASMLVMAAVLAAGVAGRFLVMRRRRTP